MAAEGRSGIFQSSGTSKLRHLPTYPGFYFVAEETDCSLRGSDSPLPTPMTVTSRNATVTGWHVLFLTAAAALPAAAQARFEVVSDGWQLYRLSGGPPWMRTDRYNIATKADRGLDRAMRKSAVMGLLPLTERKQRCEHSLLQKCFSFRWNRTR